MLVTCEKQKLKTDGLQIRNVAYYYKKITETKIGTATQRQ